MFGLMPTRWVARLVRIDTPMPLIMVCRSPGKRNGETLPSAPEVTLPMTIAPTADRKAIAVYSASTIEHSSTRITMISGYSGFSGLSDNGFVQWKAPGVARSPSVILRIRFLVHEVRAQCKNHKLRRIIRNINDQSSWCQRLARHSGYTHFLHCGKLEIADLLSKANEKRPGQIVLTGVIVVDEGATRFTVTLKSRF